MSVQLGVLNQIEGDERRVGITPSMVVKWAGLGVDVAVEAGAGESAGFADAAFTDAGASIRPAQSIASDAVVLLWVRPPTAAEIDASAQGVTHVGMLAPHLDTERFAAMAARGQTALSAERIPRITRAQSMDVLSSQAACAGYRSVLLAAAESPRFFPMLTTAAGTIRPATVLVIGAGVAGLQALATARRLGAITEGFDVRPETREQVQSLGAKFLDLGVSAAGEGGYARELTDEERDEQQRQLTEHLSGVDVLISTAAIPGKPSPKIITQDMVEQLPHGAVIMDLAAEGGGNCVLTEPGKTVVHDGVTIAGPLNVPSGVAADASQMIARNFFNLLSPFIEDGEFKPDFDDEVLAGAAVVIKGEQS